MTKENKYSNTEINKELVSLVKNIERAYLEGGRKIKMEEIANRVPMSRAHFSSIYSGARLANRKLINSLLQGFRNELNRVPSLPGDKFNRERAIIKVLMHRIAKLESSVYDRDVSECLRELEQDTKLEMNNLEQQVEGA